MNEVEKRGIGKSKVGLIVAFVRYVNELEQNIIRESHVKGPFRLIYLLQDNYHIGHSKIE